MAAMGAREIHVHVHVHDDAPDPTLLLARVAQLERKVAVMAGGLDALEAEMQEAHTLDEALTALLNVQAGQIRSLGEQIVELGGDDARAQQMAAEWDQRNAAIAALLASFTAPTDPPAEPPAGDQNGTGDGAGEVTPGEDAPLTPPVEDALAQTGGGLVDAGSSADVPAGGSPVDPGESGQPSGV